jgi:hypothetical protein
VPNLLCLTRARNHYGIWPAVRYKFADTVDGRVHTVPLAATITP